jgi:hypothetical protein
MRREIVRDRAGKVLGWYEDNDVSGRINARDSAGRWLGYYDCSFPSRLLPCSAGKRAFVMSILAPGLHYL